MPTAGPARSAASVAILRAAGSWAGDSLPRQAPTSGSKLSALGASASAAPDSLVEDPTGLQAKSKSETNRNGSSVSTSSARSAALGAHSALGAWVASSRS